MNQREELISKLRSIGHLQACRRFFLLLKEAIEVINVDEQDARISFYTRKDKGISATINLHRALAISNKNGVWFELAFLEKDRNLIENLSKHLLITDLAKDTGIVYVKFSADESHLLEDTRLMVAWQNALIELLSRGAASPKHPIHNLLLFQLAENENARNELFWEVEHPSEVFRSVEIVAEPTEQYKLTKPAFSKNQLFYGPPGTGKTYTAKQLASAYAYGVLTFHPAFGYHDFVEGLRPEVLNGQVNYSVKEGIFLQFCRKALHLAGYDSFAACLQDSAENRKIKLGNAKPFVVLIDEMNRANIASVFGELITLLEPNKRLGEAEEMVVQLPYSLREVGIPTNLYLIGTMNAADRTTTVIDNALRRRFSFRAFQPNYVLLPVIDGIETATFLSTLNERISYYLGEDFEVGHAYLMGVSTYEQLCEAMVYQLIPLLFEYFADAPEKVPFLFGDHLPEKQAKFILSQMIDYQPQATNGWDEPSTKYKFRINPELLTATLDKSAFLI